MTEQALLESFIVRVYRVDTDKPGKIAGVVEALDGTGRQEPFAGIDELAAILERRKRTRRKTTRSGRRQ